MSVRVGSRTTPDDQSFYSENRILAPWRKIATTVIVGVGFIVLLILLATLSLMSHIKQVDSMTRALRKQDERLQQLIHSVQDAIVTVDTALRIVMVNHAAKNVRHARQRQRWNRTHQLSQ